MIESIKMTLTNYSILRENQQDQNFGNSQQK